MEVCNRAVHAGKDRVRAVQSRRAGPGGTRADGLGADSAVPLWKMRALVECAAGGSSSAGQGIPEAETRSTQGVGQASPYLSIGAVSNPRRRSFR